jgi:hypothetical protein
VVNKSKTGVAKPSVQKCLGFSYTSGKLPRRRIAPQALASFKAKTRELTRQTRKLEQIVKKLSVYLIGWRDYFGFCQTPSVLHSLDNWLQRRLRAITWKQWKRGPTSSRPVSSPFGRRQKLGLLLCALLLTIAVAALRVSLKAETGGSTGVASVKIKAHGRMASVPPDNVEPRQPIMNAVKSSVATQTSPRWNFVPLAATPSLPPDNDEPRQPTRDAVKSSAATDIAAPSLPPDNAKPRQPIMNAVKSSSATDIAAPSLPPDNAEPRQPIMNAVKSSSATDIAAPALPPNNDEPRQPTTNVGNSSPAMATRSLPPDNAEARQPTTNAGKSSAAPAMATLSLPPLPRHRPMNNRSKRNGSPHQPTTTGGKSSVATATPSLPRDNDEVGQLITKTGKSSAATPSLPPDGLTPSLVIVLRKLRVIAHDAVDLPTNIVGKINAALRG